MSDRDVIHRPLDVPCIAGIPGSCFGLSLYSSHNLFLKFLLFSLLYTSVQRLGAQPLLFSLLGHNFVPERHRHTSGSLCTRLQGCKSFLRGLSCLETWFASALSHRQNILK